MKKVINNILTIIFIVSSSILMISSSIIVPCTDRNFYYIQIDNLDIVEENSTKFNKDSIIKAYDDVLDFIWKDAEFKTGVLKFSDSGKSHFEDCKKLFLLDLYTFIISLSIFIIILLLDRFKIIELINYHKLSPIFYSATISLILIGSFGIIAIADFDSAFELFHKILFPGKDNWLFNPYKDEVIWILPEKYFMNCGILIGVIFITQITISYLYTFKKKRYIK